MKICTRCGQMLPLDEFYHWKGSPDGHTAYCKPCHKSRRPIVIVEIDPSKPLNTKAFYTKDQARMRLLGKITDLYVAHKPVYDNKIVPYRRDGVTFQNFMDIYERYPGKAYDITIIHKADKEVIPTPDEFRVLFCVRYRHWKNETDTSKHTPRRPKDFLLPWQIKEINNHGTVEPAVDCVDDVCGRIDCPEFEGEHRPEVIEEDKD